MKNFLFVTLFLNLFLGFSHVATAQKTAAQVVDDVLNMSYPAGNIGWKVNVVVPSEFVSADFFLQASDIKSKKLNSFSNIMIKYFDKKAASKTTLGAGASMTNVATFLSLSQPGLVATSTTVNLGNFYYINSLKTEFTFGIPSSLSVITTTVGPVYTLHGKVNVSKKLINGQTFTSEDVIYIRVSPQGISG